MAPRSLADSVHDCDYYYDRKIRYQFGPLDDIELRKFQIEYAILYVKNFIVENFLRFLYKSSRYSLLVTKHSSKSYPNTHIQGVSE